METSEIFYCMQQDEMIRKCLRGVYPCNRLPEDDGMCVANEDPAGEPGSHWVFVWRNARKTVYFDSFARAPIGCIRLYGLNRYGEIQVNSRRVQSDASSTCGNHCIFVAFHLARGLDIREIENNIYTEDAIVNDRMVFDFVNERFNIETNLVDFSTIYPQISVPWKPDSFTDRQRW